VNISYVNTDYQTHKCSISHSLNPKYSSALVCPSVIQISCRISKWIKIFI